MIVSCTSQPATPERQSIFEKTEYIALLTAADQRDIDAFIPFLTSTDKELKLLALQHAASLTDKKLYPSLLKALDDTTNMSIAAAIALGQQHDSALYDALNDHFLAANTTETKSALLQAMAHCLPQLKQSEFISLLSNAPCENAPMWAAFLTIQGQHPVLVPDVAIANLNCQNKDARLAAAHYLSRAPNVDLTSSFIQLVRYYEQETDLDVKIALANTFKKSSHPETGNWVISELKKPELDERLAANLLRGAQFQNTLTAEAILFLCRDHRPHIASIAANSISKSDIGHDSLQALTSSPNATVALHALVTLKPEKGVVAQKIQSLNDPYQQVAAIRALAKTNLEKEFLESLLIDQHPSIRTTALETLLTYDTPDIEQYLLKALEISEEGQLAILGTYLIDKPELVIPEIKSLLVQSADGCVLPRMVETYNAIIDALAATGDSTRNRYDYKGTNVPDFKLLSSFPDTIQVSIQTSKGKIDVELYARIAPGTVAAFLKLADGGFYDNKIFHRVVPNFVVQGGCPRGDGWGSSDEVIRSEFSAEKYSSGTLGMASAGKDTESCQWFITHSPTPHLEGRYTVFGRVITGMDVVRKIEEGDRISGIVF